MGVFDVFSAKPGEQAGRDIIGGINRGQEEAQQQFGAGRGALTTNYAKGLSEWDPVYGTANKGLGAYADATGLGGAEGNTRALAGFRNNPAYQFQLQQGLDAARAAQAKSGFTGSGNAQIDLNNYSQGVANQGWGDYINRLSPYLGLATTAAGARSNIDTGLGNALNQSYTNEGNLDYGAATSRGQAQAGIDTAGYNASKNLWGTGLALAGDVAQAMGGGKGGGGFNYADLFGGFNKQPGGSGSGGYYGGSAQG